MVSRTQDMIALIIGSAAFGALVPVVVMTMTIPETKESPGELVSPDTARLSRTEDSEEAREPVVPDRVAVAPSPSSSDPLIDPPTKQTKLRGYGGVCNRVFEFYGEGIPELTRRWISGQVRAIDKEFNSACNRYIADERVSFEECNRLIRDERELRDSRLESVFQEWVPDWPGLTEFRMACAARCFGDRVNKR